MQKTKTTILTSYLGCEANAKSSLHSLSNVASVGPVKPAEDE